MYASANFLGRVTRDLELKKMNSQGNEWSALDFSMACKTKGGKEDEFFDFQATNKAAETIAQYVKKGDVFFVEAEPRVNKWEKQIGGDTVRFQRTVYHVNRFTFLPQAERKGNGGQQQNNNAGGQAPWQQQAPQQNTGFNQGGFNPQQQQQPQGGFQGFPAGPQQQMPQQQQNFGPDANRPNFTTDDMPF